MLIIPARARAIFHLYQEGCVRVVSDRGSPAQAELFTQKYNADFDLEPTPTKATSIN